MSITTIYFGLTAVLLPLLGAAYIWKPATSMYQKTRLMGGVFGTLGSAYRLSSILFLIYGLLNFCAVALPLLNESYQGGALILFFASIPLPIISWFLFLFVLMNNPQISATKGQVIAAFAVCVGSIAAFGGVLLVGNTTPNAPFIYDDASVTVLNPDGDMPADDEMASYCAGQTLLVQFGGRSDGTGRSTHVSGTLLRIELGINDSIQLGEVAGGTYDKVTLVREPSEPQSFAILPPFSGFVIPETVTNGLYVWRHSNRAVDESGAAVSLVDSFTTEQFEIERCESQNIP